MAMTIVPDNQSNKNGIPVMGSFDKQSQYSHSTNKHGSIAHLRKSIGKSQARSKNQIIEVNAMNFLAKIRQNGLIDTSHNDVSGSF